MVSKFDSVNISLNANRSAPGISLISATSVKLDGYAILNTINSSPRSKEHRGRADKEIAYFLKHTLGVPRVIHISESTVSPSPHGSKKPDFIDFVPKNHRRDKMR
jgi:hypothetical protein